MVTSNDLSGSTLDRKYGPIESYEVIDFFRMTHTPDLVNHFLVPSVKISTSDLLNIAFPRTNMHINSCENLTKSLMLSIEIKIRTCVQLEVYSLQMKQRIQNESW